MLDLVLAGVTGLVLAALLSRPPKPAAPPKQAQQLAPATRAATPARAAAAARPPAKTNKWD